MEEKTIAAMPQEQVQYLSLLGDILSDRYHTDSPKAFVHTYGCQQNVADSEKLKGMLLQMGYAAANGMRFDR